MLENKISGLWTEDYRPKSLNDMVYCDAHETLFRNIVDKKEIPNLMLHGFRAGGGKTSTIKAMLNDLGIEYDWINGSNKTGIDVINGRMESFITTESNHSSKFPFKIIVIDEIDGTSPEFKDAFKGFIEKYPNLVRFWCTTNYIHKMNEFESSRMINVSFDFTEDQLDQIKPKFVMRMVKILQDKKIEINEDTVSALKYIAIENAPDMRKAIQHLYKTYLMYGTIDMRCKEITIEDEDIAITELIFDCSKTIKDRYVEFLTMFKKNPSSVNRVMHIVDELVLPKILNDMGNELLFIRSLKMLAEEGKTYNTHPQKDVLVKSLLVQLMGLISKEGEN